MVQENATNADFSNYVSTFTLFIEHALVWISHIRYAIFSENENLNVLGSFVNLSVEDLPWFAIQVIAVSLTPRFLTLLNYT